MAEFSRTIPSPWEIEERRWLLYLAAATNDDAKFNQSAALRSSWSRSKQRMEDADKEAKEKAERPKRWTVVFRSRMRRTVLLWHLSASSSPTDSILRWLTDWLTDSEWICCCCCTDTAWLTGWMCWLTDWLPAWFIRLLAALISAFFPNYLLLVSMHIAECCPSCQWTCWNCLLVWNKVENILSTFDSSYFKANCNVSIIFEN